MGYRLAAFDVDGTLIGQDRTVPESAVAAIRGLVARGVTVAVATSRPYHIALRQFEEMGVEAAALTSAGADVRLATGIVVSQTPIEPAAAAFVADVCDRARWQATIAAPDCFIQRGDERPPWLDRAPPFLRFTTSIARDLPGQFLAMIATVAKDDPQVARLIDSGCPIRVDRAISFNGDMMITVTDAGTNKGTALRALCGALDLDPAETVAFGDAEVDLPMFETAGLAVAMGNATDAVKAAADLVTGDVQADGLADAIREIWR